MIKLEVKEYCHKCPSFVAEVESPLIAESLTGEFNIAFGDTVVKCKNASKCGIIYDYLKSRKD